MHPVDGGIFIWRGVVGAKQDNLNGGSGGPCEKENSKSIVDRIGGETSGGGGRRDKVGAHVINLRDRPIKRKQQIRSSIKARSTDQPDHNDRNYNDQEERLIYKPT